MAKERLRRNGEQTRRSVDKELWERILKSFRTHGQNFTQVGKDCGVSAMTARKAWREGWANKEGMEFAVPIRDYLQQEKVRARAALQREKDALVKDHRIASQASLKEAIDAGFKDLVDSRAKQGKVIRAARDNSFAALVVASKLLKASVPLADKIATQLETEDLPVKERLAALRAVSRFTKDAADIAQIADDMERKALGEPDTILQVQHGVSMNIEEAKEALADVAELLETYGEDGIDSIVDVDADWAEESEEGPLIHDHEADEEDQEETTEHSDDQGAPS